MATLEASDNTLAGVTMRSEANTSDEADSSPSE